MYYITYTFITYQLSISTSQKHFWIWGWPDCWINFQTHRWCKRAPVGCNAMFGKSHIHFGFINSSSKIIKQSSSIIKSSSNIMNNNQQSSRSLKNNQHPDDENHPKSQSARCRRRARARRVWWPCGVPGGRWCSAQKGHGPRLRQGASGRWRWP